MKTPKNMIFQLSADTKLLYRTLLSVKVGQLLSFATISKTIGVKVDGSFRALQSARRKALNHDGIVFGAVVGVGIRRLTDVEIVDSVASDRRYIRNKARRSAIKLLTVDYSKLSKKSKVEYIAALSIFGAMTRLTDERNVLKVESYVGDQELPLVETVAAIEGTL